MNDVAMRVRKRLAEELTKVSHWLVSLQGTDRSQELEAAGDNTPLSEAADAAQVIEERENTTQLLDWLVGRSVELRHALRRIDQGTYGVCERCDEFIHPERLRAVPEASFCAECQAKTEQHRQAMKISGPGRMETARAARAVGRLD